jgi:hypothetical protein
MEGRPLYWLPDKQGSYVLARRVGDSLFEEEDGSVWEMPERHAERANVAGYVADDLTNMPFTNRPAVLHNIRAAQGQQGGCWIGPKCVVEGSEAQVVELARRAADRLSASRTQCIVFRGRAEGHKARFRQQKVALQGLLPPCLFQRVEAAHELIRLMGDDRVDVVTTLQHVDGAFRGAHFEVFFFDKHLQDLPCFAHLKCVGVQTLWKLHANSSSLIHLLPRDVVRIISALVCSDWNIPFCGVEPHLDMLMEKAGFEPDDVSNVCSILEGVLRLRRVQVGGTAGDQGQVDLNDQLVQAWRVKLSDLERALLKSKLRTGGRLADEVEFALEKSEVEQRIVDLAAFVYERLFRFLVRRLNEFLSHDCIASTKSLSLVLSRGFGGGGSGFSDLLSSTVEEGIRETLNKVHFERERLLGMPFVDYGQMTAFRFLTTAPNSSLFALLIEESLFPRSSAASIISNLRAVSQKSRHLIVHEKEKTFEVDHFFGWKAYKVDSHWLRRVRDSFQTALSSCEENALLTELVSDDSLDFKSTHLQSIEASLTKQKRRNTLRRNLALERVDYLGALRLQLKTLRKKMEIADISVVYSVSMSELKEDVAVMGLCELVAAVRRTLPYSVSQDVFEARYGNHCNGANVNSRVFGGNVFMSREAYVAFEQEFQERLSSFLAMCICLSRLGIVVGKDVRKIIFEAMK